MSVILNYRKLERNMLRIASEYIAYRRICATFPGETEEERKALLEPAEYVNRVDNVYLSLSSPEKSLINNEFFYEGYPYWWVGIYSRPAFYRMKKEVMRKFVEDFYNA